jgi:hypothetical protein
MRVVFSWGWFSREDGFLVRVVFPWGWVFREGGFFKKTTTSLLSHDQVIIQIDGDNLFFVRMVFQ